MTESLKPDEILTIADVARELKCSKLHVYHAIRGEIVGVTSLPAISMGTRRLVRRRTFEQWKEEDEATAVSG